MYSNQKNERGKENLKLFQHEVLMNSFELESVTRDPQRLTLWQSLHIGLGRYNDPAFLSKFFDPNLSPDIRGHNTTNSYSLFQGDHLRHRGKLRARRSHYATSRLRSLEFQNRPWLQHN